jgi:hypothetical protein
MAVKPETSQSFLQSIVERFAIDGLYMKAQPYGAGHHGEIRSSEDQSGCVPEHSSDDAQHTESDRASE